MAVTILGPLGVWQPCFIPPPGPPPALAPGAAQSPGLGKKTPGGDTVITRCRQWPTQSREGMKRQRPGQHRGKSGPPVVWVETQRGPHLGTLRVWGASLNFRAAILWGSQAEVWRAACTRRSPKLAVPSVPSPGGLTLQTQCPTRQHGHSPLWPSLHRAASGLSQGSPGGWTSPGAGKVGRERG